MSWDCGICKARLRDAVPRCFYCDVQEIADLQAKVAEQSEEIVKRDQALAQWASSFAPNRPLGVQFPPLESGRAGRG